MATPLRDVKDQLFVVNVAKEVTRLTAVPLTLPNVSTVLVNTYLDPKNVKYTGESLKSLLYSKNREFPEIKQNCTLKEIALMTRISTSVEH